MIDKVDFADLTDWAMAQAGRAHMRPVIEKELLHYDILVGLDRDGLLDELTNTIRSIASFSLSLGDCHDNRGKASARSL